MAKPGEQFYTDAVDQRAHPSRIKSPSKVTPLEGAMHDSRRYLDSAAECLLAAQEACELYCRGLLAREYCAQCHAIDNTSESPLAAAPPFGDLHLKYAVSDLQRPLTQGPHTKFRFEPSQIEALMAYLKTIGR